MQDSIVTICVIFERLVANLWDFTFQISDLRQSVVRSGALQKEEVRMN